MERSYRVTTNDGEEFEVPLSAISQMKAITDFNVERLYIDTDSTTFTRVLHFLDTYKGEVHKILNHMHGKEFNPNPFSQLELSMNMTPQR